jgi:acetylglutamate kinase
MQKNINIVVVKIGGSTLGGHDTTIKDLVAIQNQHIPVVVVHGGAKTASEWLAKLNIKTNFINGLRVTDKDSLGVVTAVYAGLVNKELVAAIHGAGGKAVGLSGSDGNLLFAEIKSPELGYVGEITQVNTKILDLLLKAGYIPVVAPISFGSIDGTATLFNVNGEG